MFIANFTPDTIEWMHVGITGKIEPDDIIEFEDARGKHILNKWGARGLLRASYEDKGNEEPLREQAMAIWRKFWVRHISVFNQHNESLKNENKPYVHPDPVTEKMAQKLNIELVGPWKLAEPKPGADPKELDALKAQMADMQSMMKDMMSMNKELSRQRDDALIKRFQDLRGEDFKEWFEKNMREIKDWPEGVQLLVKAQWEITQEGELYPLTA